jgi:hypothetical protein
MVLHRLLGREGQAMTARKTSAKRGGKLSGGRRPRQVPPGFMTIPEAGAQVGMPRGRAYAAAKRGVFPVIWVSAHNGLVPADWLEKKRAAAETEADEKQQRYVAGLQASGAVRNGAAGATPKSNNSTSRGRRNVVAPSK